MKVIHTDYKHVNDVMVIINQAKDYFKRNSINQWQDGYPNEESITNDIKNNKSYILIDNNTVLGTMFFAIQDDPTYSYIEGKWLSDNDYAVIHRIAVNKNMKGNNLAFELVKYVIAQCNKKNINSIRIDTHKDNISMQKFLKKHNFVPCGTIYLENGDPRIAFEKILS